MSNADLIKKISHQMTIVLVAPGSSCAGDRLLDLLTEAGVSSVPERGNGRRLQSSSACHDVMGQRHVTLR